MLIRIFSMAINKKNNAMVSRVHNIKTPFLYYELLMVLNDLFKADIAPVMA